MARDQNAQLLRSLAGAVAHVVNSHLDDGALIVRWLRALLDAEREGALPVFSHAAFLDVLGGEIIRGAPNDERALALVADLLGPSSRASSCQQLSPDRRP